VDVTPTVSDGGSTSFDANAAANSQEIQVAAPSLTSAVSGGNEPASASPAISFPGKSPSCRPDRSVFSSEDDLFRTKWGWAAYNAAQQEAAKESADQSAR
jgi:hypothetical protein